MFLVPWVVTLESKDPRICRDEGKKNTMMRKNLFEEKTKKNQVRKDTHQEKTWEREGWEWQKIYSSTKKEEIKENKNLQLS